MKKILSYKNRLLFTAIISMLTYLQIAWDYFHDGVPTHYLFQSGSLPGISNWWGVLVMPLIVWIILHRIKQREEKDSSAQNFSRIRLIVIRFVSALLVAITISILFNISSSGLDYIMIGLFILAIFIPLFYIEYLLGFIIGAAFTFGVGIPTLFGPVLLLIFAIIYKLPRIVISLFHKK